MLCGYTVLRCIELRSRRLWVRIPPGVLCHNLLRDLRLPVKSTVRHMGIAVGHQSTLFRTKLVSGRRFVGGRVDPASGRDRKHFGLEAFASAV